MTSEPPPCFLAGVTRSVEEAGRHIVRVLEQPRGEAQTAKTCGLQPVASGCRHLGNGPSSPSRTIGWTTEALANIPTSASQETLGQNHPAPRPGAPNPQKPCKTTDVCALLQAMTSLGVPLLGATLSGAPGAGELVPPPLPGSARPLGFATDTGVCPACTS